MVARGIGRILRSAPISPGQPRRAQMGNLSGDRRGVHLQLTTQGRFFLGLTDAKHTLSTSVRDRLKAVKIGLIMRIL
jgi:hypothetical protein